MRTERQFQQHAAVERAALIPGGQVWRHHYICDDGFTFSAIAPTEAGAFRVLNAERPGMMARYDGTSFCPIETHAAQLKHAGAL